MTTPASTFRYFDIADAAQNNLRGLYIRTHQLLSDLIAATGPSGFAFQGQDRIKTGHAEIPEIPQGWALKTLEELPLKALKPDWQTLILPLTGDVVIGRREAAERVNTPHDTRMHFLARTPCMVMVPPSDACTVLTPNAMTGREIDTQWLVWALRHQQVASQMTPEALQRKGQACQSIQEKLLEHVWLAVPPRQVQRDIVQGFQQIYDHFRELNLRQISHETDPVKLKEMSDRFDCIMPQVQLGEQKLDLTQAREWETARTIRQWIPPAPPLPQINGADLSSRPRP